MRKIRFCALEISFLAVQCAKRDFVPSNFLFGSSRCKNISIVCDLAEKWQSELLFAVVISYFGLQKIEGRVASDEDLKLSDTLRYVMGDTFAAKRLLYRRLRCLANYENANRNLEKARARNRDVHAVSNYVFFKDILTRIYEI